MFDCKINIVDPSVNFVEKINSKIQEDINKYKKLIIIFPNKRPLRFILKNLTTEQILKIETFSFVEFVKNIILSFSKEKPSFQSILERYFFIFEILKNNKILFDALGGDDYYVFPWVKRLSNLFNEIEMQLVEDRVQNFQYVEALKPAEKILSNLKKIFKDYQIKSKELNVVFGGSIYKYAVDLSESKEFLESFKDCKFLICGFSVLSKSEEKIIKNLINYFDVEIFVQRDLFQRYKINNYNFSVYEIIDRFKGKEKEEIYGDVKTPKNIEVIECYDVHSEVSYVASVLDKIFNEASGLIGIILPDSKALFPLLSLTENLEKKNITISYPFANTGFGIFIKSLFECLIDIEKNKEEHIINSSFFLKLLDSEFLEYFIFSKKINKNNLIDYILKNNIRKIDFKNFSCFDKKIEHDIKLIYLEIFFNFLRTNNFLEFYEELNLFIKKIDFNKLQNQDLDKSTVYYFYENIILKIKQLIDKQKFKLVNYSIRFISLIIEELSKNILIPFIGNPLEKIQIMGVLEARCLSFEYLFILDVNEGIMPSIEKPDPLLPEEIKNELGLLTKDRELLMKYNFFRIIDSSKNVFIFYQAGQTNEEKRVRSRFIEQIILKKEFDQKNIKIKKIDISINFFSDKKDGIIKNSELNDKVNKLLLNNISSTFIDEYLICPYKFYLKRINLIEERKSISDESFLHGEIGVIIHYILEKGFRLYVNQVIDYETLKKIKNLILKEIKNFLFHGYFNNEIFNEENNKIKDIFSYITLVDNFRKKLFFEVISHRINKLFETFLNDIKKVEKTIVKSVEKQIFLNNEYNFIGIIDRIDLLEDNQDKIIKIIDYKTGLFSETPSKTKLKSLMEVDFYEKPLFSKEELELVRNSIKSIQLPFYIYLYKKCYNFKDKIIAGLYKLAEPNIKFNEFEFNENFTLESFEKVLFYLLNHLKNSTKFYAFPGLYCKFCEFSYICKFI